MNDWKFSTADVRSLIEGRYYFTTCPECIGKGWIWLDGQNGKIIGEDFCKGQEGLDFYADECPECSGLGGFLKILG